MTRRFCVIGNSHVGAIKTGWDRIPQADRPMSLDFFASRSQTLAETHVENGVLKSDDERVRRSLELTGGAPEIDLRLYDGFVVTGCGVHFRQLAQMLETVALHPHERYGLRLISEPLLLESLVVRLENTSARLLIERIAGASDAPIFVLPEPLFGRGVLADGQKPFTRLIHEQERGEAFAEMFDVSCGRAFSRRARFIAQPAETREDHIFTADRFSEDGVGIRKMIGQEVLAQKRKDFVHKNAEFGELMLRALIAAA